MQTRKENANMKKAKQLFGKTISIIFAFVMILTAIPSDVVTAYAEEAALLSDVEKAISEELAKDLYSSDYKSGDELNSGVYYLSADKTFGSHTSGTNGLKIKSGATVYIYIPADVTLTALGKNGDKQTAGYAGILVPEGSTLVLLGDGTVVAKGGKAGNGSDGGTGTSFTTSYISYSNDTVTIPKGGNGGPGGGGAGAGIGTDGGAGGSKNGAGGSSYTIDKDSNNGESASTSQKGGDGQNGSSALAVGQIYRIGVTIDATGGKAGTKGSEGYAGSSLNVVTEDYFYAPKGSDTLRGVAGGAGGGGGGAGSAGAGIGTGGGGGGQGGGGGSAGYTWTCYYIGGGGGGGGQGRNDAGSYTYGTGGKQGSTTKFTDHDERKDEMTIFASDGASDSTRAGGKGAKAYTTGNSGAAWGRGGAGGTGGQAGGAYEETTVQTSNFPTSISTFAVTFEGAKTTDGLNVQNYSYGVANTIQVPEYDGNANTCFLGWEVMTYGAYVDSEGMLSETDVTIYQPGETINLDPGFSGNVVLVARTAAMQGVSAMTETLVIEAEKMEEEVSYYTYQVKAYLDNEISDVGNLELRTADGVIYEIAYEDGVYSFITDLSTEFSLYRNGKDTGIKVTSDNAAELKLYTASITTNLDDIASAEMGIVSLKGEDAPSLSTVPNSGKYSAINQLNNVQYKVFVDGMDTGNTVAYGSSLVLDYYTTTLTVSGNARPESVVLVANNGSARVELHEVAENAYSSIKLKHDLIYTLYINGQKTTFTDICFDQKNELSVNYNKTVITTTLDGAKEEVGVVTLEQNQTMKEEDGIYSSTDITYLGDVLTGSLSVNDRLIGIVGLGDGPTVSYYSVEYFSEHSLLGKLPTDSTVYLDGDQVLLAPAVTSEDIAYQFIGWYVDGELYEPGETVTVAGKKVEVTAAWKDTEFSIQYNMDLENALNAPTNPEFYIINGGDVVISEPTADGYIFDGWTYEDVDGMVYEPQKSLVISADARWNYELVANWSPKTYQIESDVLDASEDLQKIISLNFGARITGYLDSLVPAGQTITITNTGNQTIVLDGPEFLGEGANYFTVTALDKTVLAPNEYATFVVQPKTGLETGVYKEVIKVSCVSEEDDTIEGNSVLFTTSFEVGRDVTAPYVKVTVSNSDVTCESDQFVFEPETGNWYKYSTKPEITIDATDLESGVSKIEYYRSKTPLTFSESGGVESIVAWKEYNENNKPFVTDSSTGAYYLYVKVTDGDGNVSYVSTEGLVVDIIAPSITFADGSVPQMNQTYVGTQTLVIKDNHLASVTVDGTEIMPGPNSEFTFELLPKLCEEQVIIATDSFGHSTEITIIVDPREYTIHMDLNGGTGTMDDFMVYEAELNLLPFLSEDCQAPYGMELLGWAIGSVDSDIVIAPGAAYMFEGDTTIYAIWKNVIYTIDYELNGGTNAESNPATFDKDTNTITIQEPTREGYFFLGWTWEAGMGIGMEAQTTPVKDLVIAIGSIQNKYFIANWEKMTDAIDEIAGSLPEADKVTSNDKADIEEALKIIEELLSDENVGSLTDDEKQAVEEQREELLEKLGKIQAAEDRMESVDETVNSLPPKDKVTSDDKAAIEDALDIIENLLAEENKDNLTAEEKKTVEEQKAELLEKLDKIQAAEDRKNAVEEIAGTLPETDKVTSEDKELIESIIEEIENILTGDDAGNLTDEEKAALEEQKEELLEKLEKIQNAEDGMETVEETVNSLLPKDKVTSDDKAAIEDALDIIENLLSEENSGNLTDEEKAVLEEQKAELLEKLEKIQAAEEKKEAVEEISNALPPKDKVTSEDKDVIESVIEEIENILAGETAGNLTDEEKAALEEEKAELLEKLEKIQAAEDGMEAVEETVNSLLPKDKVTSDDKAVIEDALDIIENLLSEENSGNLTDEEKAVLEEQKAELLEKLEKIQAAEEKMEAVEETVNSLLPKDKVTSDDKAAIEDALDIIENLLSEENSGNLTDEEKVVLEEQKAELEEKLSKIQDAEDRMETVDETVNSLPTKDKVTSDDKAAIEDALNIIDKLLAEENKDNLTADEKKTVESQKAELEEKLEIIQMVEDTMTDIQDKKEDIPSKDVITTEYKDVVVELLDSIKDLLDNHPDNLTEEQKEALENLKEELQEKSERIQVIEDSLVKVENDSIAQPDYDDITSDNKEDIKDIIENIENILAGDKDNLSSEEIEQLEEQKKELEDKITFIEKIEKYEPVSDDFVNVTEPEKNENNGNLVNDSQELIQIIPLEKTEKEHVAKGESVKVYLEVTDITETVVEEDKNLIEKEIEEKEVAVYLDLTLFKQIGNREPKKVANTLGVVTISFQVPTDLLNKDTSVARKYQIVRVHKGEVSIIDATFDEATGEISFETDKFSTYALIYEDVEIEVPQTGDSTPVWPWMLLVIGFAVLVLSTKVGSMNTIEKR